MKTVEELKQMKYDITREMGDYLECLTEWTTYIEEREREDGDLYQKGLEDAWELARKLLFCEANGGMSLNEITECFGSEYNIASPLQMDVAEAKAKYDAWKEKKEQDEIKVGDVVYWKTLYEKMIVIKKVDDRYGLIHLSDGSYDTSDECYLLKTGEHYDLPWLKECQ